MLFSCTSRKLPQVNNFLRENFAFSVAFKPFRLTFIPSLSYTWVTVKMLQVINLCEFSTRAVIPHHYAQELMDKTTCISPPCADTVSKNLSSRSVSSDPMHNCSRLQLYTDESIKYWMQFAFKKLQSLTCHDDFMCTLRLFTR